MCTVSFVNNQGKIILTSNRDEKTIRSSAIPPENYTKNGRNIIFPKDPDAGGTWYAINDKGTVIILLNGAAEKHLVKLPYRKSRGLIVLDIINHESSRKKWDTINLQNIEPFTLILYEGKNLFQLRWNGLKKESLELDVNKNHIWSSVTLYPEEIRTKRAIWFNAFLENKKLPIDILQFHKYTEQEDKENGLIINRNNQLKTVSITQTVLEDNKAIIEYHDLATSLYVSLSFNLNYFESEAAIA